MKKSPKNPQRGNIFLYLLIAVALFAALTMILSRSDDAGEKTTLDQASLKTTAQRLLTYVNQTSDSWLRMQNTGSDLDDLDLTLPSAGSFNSAPTIHKIFHPDGGGLLYRDMNEADFRASATTPVGWHLVKVNADWTPSTGTDLVLTYLNIRRDLCAELNRLSTGSTTIPTTTVNYTNTFVNASAALTATACSACVTSNSLCVNNSGVYAFYNLLQAR